MLKIGHRGTAGLRPENTRVGFEKAIELGLDMVEVDVQLTKDNQIVVIHDFNLSRIAGKKTKIKDLTLAQLKQVDIGSHFAPTFSQQRVLTLKELIELVKGKMMLNIELKMIGTKSELLISKLVDLLEQERFSDEVIISSFKHSYLQEIDSKFKTAILINSCPIDPVAMIESANADGVHPNYKFLTPELINRVQSSGCFVNIWTVNQQSEIRKLEGFGVDGIITDNPQLFF